MRGDIYFVQHAVDAVANAQFRFLRLNVNIGSALPVGLGDDLVDETDYRSLFAHLVDIDLGHGAGIIIDGIAPVLNHLLDCVGAHAVVFLDRFLDFLARGKSGFHRAAEHQPYAVDCFCVKGIGCGDSHYLAIKPKRQHIELIYRCRGQTA